MATVEKSEDLITYDITSDSLGTCHLDSDRISTERLTRLHNDIVFCEVYVKDKKPEYGITLHVDKSASVAERKLAVQKVLEFLKDCGAIEGAVANIMKTVKSW